MSECIGYPDCDGDLPGEEHSPDCPLSYAPPDEQLKLPFPPGTNGLTVSVTHDIAE